MPKAEVLIFQVSFSLREDSNINAVPLSSQGPHSTAVNLLGKDTLKPNRAPSAKSEAKKKEVRKCELTLRKRSNEWER